MEFRIRSCFWNSSTMILHLVVFLTFAPPCTPSEATISLYYGKDTLYPDYKQQTREETEELSEKQNGKLKERFKDMLGFGRAPSSGDKPATRGQSEVPRYMRRLYDKHRNSMMYNGEVLANTVTSIIGRIGRLVYFKRFVQSQDLFSI